MCRYNTLPAYTTNITAFEIGKTLMMTYFADIQISTMIYFAYKRRQKSGNAAEKETKDNNVNKGKKKEATN